LVSDKQFDELLPLFVKAFANPPRDPEEDFNATHKAALFVLNDEKVLGLLQPRDGNLVERLNGRSDAAAVAEELYLSILGRKPSEEEAAEVFSYLNENAAPERRPVALGHLAWALLGSTEFCVNH
jgi:hypothetical protein